MNSSFGGRVGGLRPSSGDGPSWLGWASVIGLTSNENEHRRSAVWLSAAKTDNGEAPPRISSLLRLFCLYLFSWILSKLYALAGFSNLTNPALNYCWQRLQGLIGSFSAPERVSAWLYSQKPELMGYFFQSVVLDVYQSLRFWFFLNIFFFLSYNKLIFHELGTCSLCEPLTERSKQCFHLHEKFVDSMNFKIQMAQPRPHRAFCNEVVSIWVKQPYYGTDFECGYI